MRGVDRGDQLIGYVQGDDQRSGGRGSSFTSWNARSSIDMSYIVGFFLLDLVHSRLELTQLLIGSFRSRQHAGHLRSADHARGLEGKVGLCLFVTSTDMYAT